MTSELLYSSGNIRVDRHFARFGEKSYAVNKINSVEIKRIPAKPSYRNIWIAIALVCGGTALFGQSLVWFVLTLFFAALGFRAHRNPNSDSFQLYLMTSSSEIQALETENKSQIVELRAAIEAAMTED